MGETNKYRVAAYFKAAQAINQMGLELSSFLPDMERLERECKHFRLGEKSIQKVVSFLIQGVLAEHEEILQKVAALPPEETKTRKSSANLRPEVNAVRRPWAQAHEVVQVISPVLEKYFPQITVCGSYRRRKDTCRDLDCVVSGKINGWPVSLLFDAVLVDLGVVPTNVIKKGEAQMSFYLDSPSGPYQIDIWYCPPESYGAAVLFATGSGDFNIGMRGWLKSRGMLLNRYGLFKVNGEDKVLLAATTEQEIFKAIGMKWVPPQERIEFNFEKYRTDW